MAEWTSSQMVHHLVLGCYLIHGMWRENTLKRECVGRSVLSAEIGGALAFPLRDRTADTSYVTHVASNVSVIHHMHAHAPKLALWRRALFLFENVCDKGTFA